VRHAIVLVVAVFLAVSAASTAQQVTSTRPAATAAALSEAPTGFDDQTNGFVDAATHEADLEVFDEFETVDDGLGPLYNAQGCRECHQDPVSGGSSQVTELRAGQIGRDGKFQNPRIPIGHGAEVITSRTLVNDRAICPSEDYPDMHIHQRVPANANIRTERLSINLLGDGFVEAVADRTLIELARAQCSSTRGRICGQVAMVPIVEAPGATGAGRFGWKDQHASLVSFSGDAYLNEMGITSRHFPDEITNLCNTVPSPNDEVGPDGLDDVDRFARFIRATKAPARDPVLSESAEAIRGSEVFDEVGCATCHVRTLVTAPPRTKIHGGTYTISDALGNKQFHPFSDFLLHNVGTGDGIPIAVQEHFSRRGRTMSPTTFSSAQNKIRTAPLWGLRLRSRLMHDGASLTLTHAIQRHAGEAQDVTQRFFALPGEDRAAVLTFLESL
jgi:CxxC motif-containing protein (DUF1111 family)